jgi:ABC-type multidrug transport system ATPase subunit
MVTNAVEAEGLTKQYGRRLVVDNLSFEVHVGEVFGLLGPNGAGKTTTLRLLSGLTKATSGTMSVLGFPVPRQWANVAGHVAAVIESSGYYSHLSAAENLRVLELTSGRRRSKAVIRKALETVGLQDVAKKRVGAFSTGMIQRLGIAGSLLAEANLLILDEPTSGLDPLGVLEVRDLIRSLAADGRTIVLSSHQLSEVEQLSSRVLLMSNGKSLRYGSLVELLKSSKQVTLAVDQEDLAVTLLGQHGISTRREGAKLVAYPAQSSVVIRILSEAGLYPTEVAERRHTLEELFLDATREAL